MGFEVQIADLRDSADAARQVANQVSGSGAGRALTVASPAMPGAACVAQMEAVASMWRREVRSWSQVARDYAAGLDRNADNYETSDEAAREAFSRPVRPLPPGDHRAVLP